MTQLLRLLHKWLNSSIAINITLILLLLMPTVALAQTSKPPDDPPPNTTGTSGGSRGCSTQTDTSLSSIPALILLAPTQRYGQTVATRSKFAWFVRDSGSYQLEFRLYEYDPTTKQSKLVKEIKDETFKSSPGIMVLSLSNPELSIGKRYLWQVELVCDSNRPSGNPFATGAMKVVSVSPDFQTKLEQANDTLSKANLYAQGDFWYDSWGIILAAKDEPSLRELKSSLLEQVITGGETSLREQAKVSLTSSAIHQLQR